MTPGPLELEYPVLLDHPAPTLNAYPRDTVAAEKFEAIVALDLANSRMKDFYDLLAMSRLFAFEGVTSPPPYGPPSRGVRPPFHANVLRP